MEGLRSFRPDPGHNPGRMNFFTRDDVSVVIDLAHNEAGLEALAALSTIVALGMALFVIMTEPIRSEWPGPHVEEAEDDAQLAGASRLYQDPDLPCERGDRHLRARYEPGRLRCGRWSRRNHCRGHCIRAG